MVGSKKKYVLDASVVLKWVLIEDEDLDQAMVLRQGFVENKYCLLVPTHFFSELCNTLGRKSPEGAVSFLSMLMMGGVMECRLTLDIAKRAFGLTQKHKKVSFYDAFYHALALELGCDFITADKNYFDKMKKEGGVVLLKDFMHEA